MATLFGRLFRGIQMSWQNLNNFELQSIRKLLCLDISEAARLIGKVSNRTWQYWESGRSPVPSDIDMEMYGLTQQRNQLITQTLEEHNYDDIGLIRWYHTFESFQSDYPECNEVLWRLHQSACAYLFAEGGDIELSDTAPLDKNGFIYKWLTKTTDEQLENAKQEAIFREKALRVKLND